MSEENQIPQGLEVRTYFVRERNALVARADFGEMYVDYYLHQSTLGHRPAPEPDAMLKDALAAAAPAALVVSTTAAVELGAA